MPHTPAPDDHTEHPASRVLVLAWVAMAAQTPVAACAWATCLAVGLLLNRWAAASTMALASSMQLPKAAPAAPARRRTDTREFVVGSRGTHPTPQLKAHGDPLTGLFTPQYLVDMGESLLQGLQARGLSLCVLKTEFDGLDDVVARYGQEAADQVLVQAARRLNHLARADDIVMRPGGHSFVLLLSCPAGECATLAPALKARVIADLQRPFAYRTVSNLRISCRAGSAIWPLHGATLDEVIHHAEEVLASPRNRLPEFA
jgi:diguanylate cyclase (GGDEF)-like protein